MIYEYSDNDDFILTTDEQTIIVDWVKKYYKYFMYNGESKYFQKLKYFNNAPQCIWDIKNRILDKENLYGFEEEPCFRDSIGIMFEGSQLHLHTDPNPTNSDLIHTRYNVYVQLPEKGGYPIYNNIHCRLKERTYICCRSGIDLHCCAKVEGNKERIVISFGFLLPMSRIENIYYNYPSGPSSSTDIIGQTAAADNEQTAPAILSA
jgi:hypothetical protein